ncbi:BTB/POZ domain-containing protein KCTD11 [Zootoca vivipara]|uniref:BTB/POZ domain-containing protein KCTD11 n=1 Tax=Zootoca vivipara TaxID=8524 RepID=UPI0015909832|nr:BTB/POZ domain-containing protein KCTD11 [Zootoca vivipara]XP_034992448.1 BTB/POZ domain-containing protein KCTD11 [Zootoca vivipara]XP_034992449.1 BTB/POZ domain-containing protein KCTD11 [Zootoca vivipara]
MPGTCEAPGRTPSLVTLNVGGKLYSTTLDTLTRFPDSMLGAMFRGPQPALTDSCGNYFIDRDGKAFRHILNFLRFGRLDLPEGYAELSLLRAEADFYQIRPLLEELRRVEAERWRQRRNAVLHADVDVRKRLLHFNIRRGPQNYELSSSCLHIFTANVFCTDKHFLALLRRRLGQLGGGVEEGHSGKGVGQSSRRMDSLGRPDTTARDSIVSNGDFGGQKRRLSGSGTSGELSIWPGDSTDEDEAESDEEAWDYSPVGTKTCHHLCLEWAPCPAELPVTEYAKQKLQPLTVGGREVRTGHEFLEEVLKVALAQGFRVDSVFPDPADILNARSLRFVRH